MVSYYNPLSYGQCANLYPNTGYWNNLPAYQQTAANAASAATLFGGGQPMHNNGVPFGSSPTNGSSGGGLVGGGGSVNSAGGGSPDSEGQSPMYYQHYQHAMFQQGSPEWVAGDRSGTPPSVTMTGNGNRGAVNRGFPYPAIGAQNHQHSAKMGNMMMMNAATDLRTNMDKLGHLTALPSPPISSPGGNCQTTKAGKTRTEDKYRVVYTDFQRMELEKEYNTSRYITIRRKTELSHSLDLSERQVKIWFQNRRAKDRKLTKKRDEVISSATGMHHHHHHHQQGGYPEDSLAFNTFDIKPKTEPGLHFQHAAAFHHQMNQHMHGMGMGLHPAAAAASNYSQHGLHHHHHHNAAHLGMTGGAMPVGAMPPATNIPPSIAPSDSPASIN